VLGGHVHQTHLSTSRTVVRGSGPGVPVLACGTSTSRRGRGPETERNGLNVVRVTSESVEVTPYLRRPDGADFEPDATVVMPRAGRADARGVAARSDRVGPE